MLRSGAGCNWSDSDRELPPAPSGLGVTIALIDSGIDANCPDLRDAIVGQKTFIAETLVSNFHGTAMAGVIGGRGDPIRGGHRGIAVAVTFIDAHAFDSAGVAYKSNILEALAWLAPQQPPFIVFGGVTLETWGEGDLLAEACQRVTDAGTILIAPAGNWGPESGTVGLPASAPAVIAIGAVTQEGEPAFFSSRGPGPESMMKPNIVLPGVNVPTVRVTGIPLGPDDNQSVPQLPIITGTSAATAIFAGIAVLVMENRRDLLPGDFCSEVAKVTENLKLRPETQGHGILNSTILAEHLGVLFPRAVSWKVIARFALLIALISSSLIIVGLILFSIFR